MIGLDTNALLRFMLRDDEPQFQTIAPHIIEAEPNGCLITLLVCLETDWVLETCYEFTKQQRIEFFNTIISVKQFAFEDVATLKRAILSFQKGNADLSDNLIAAQAKTLGADRVLTFDKKASSAGMEYLADS
ncbi:MAG: type II toxin-antitoxin system VapC family toxin [Immundisolibacteraceae bacterium]|nr:type II toxin-antitoxin system VapC family toxin [Immundisolibacteraceae bacterium]